MGSSPEAKRLRRSVGAALAALAFLAAGSWEVERGSIAHAADRNTPNLDGGVTVERSTTSYTLRRRYGNGCSYRFSVTTTKGTLVTFADGTGWAKCGEPIGSGRCECLPCDADAGYASRFERAHVEHSEGRELKIVYDGGVCLASVRGVVGGCEVDSRDESKVGDCPRRDEQSASFPCTSAHDVCGVSLWCECQEGTGTPRVIERAR